MPILKKVRLFINISIKDKVRKKLARSHSTGRFNVYIDVAICFQYRELYELVLAF